MTCQRADPESVNHTQEPTGIIDVSVHTEPTVSKLVPCCIVSGRFRALACSPEPACSSSAGNAGSNAVLGLAACSDRAHAGRLNGHTNRSGSLQASEEQDRPEATAVDEVGSSNAAMAARTIWI